MNCIECNKPLYNRGTQFRCCDAFVCGLICSKNRMKRIKEIDPNMDNPLNWNNIIVENKPMKNNEITKKNKGLKNIKSNKNLQIIGMPYESIKLNKPVPFVKTHIINIKNYKDDYHYSNNNINNKISEIIVKGSIMIILGLYLKNFGSQILQKKMVW